MGECLHILAGHQGMVMTLLFHPWGQTLISGSLDEIIRVLAVQTGHGQKILHLR